MTEQKTNRRRAGRQDRLVESAKEAAEYLADKEGKILLTTGSKELEAFTRIPDYRERVYARYCPCPRWWKNAIALDWKDDISSVCRGRFQRN